MAPPLDLRLLVVTDGSGDLERLERVARASARGGARALQVREPGLSSRLLFETVRRLRDVFPPGEALLLVNDRADVAAAAGADGVQLGFRSYHLGAARRFLGPRARIGVSTHSVEEVLAARGADLLLFGPVFETPSKRGRLAPRGVAGLREAVAASPAPVVAIGGVDAERARACAEAGAAGVACIRAVFEAADPEAASRAILRRFEEGRG